MTKLLKTTALAAGVGLVSLSAHAAFTANDLYLGFTGPGETGDYIIDLGQPGTIGVGGSTIVDLSSHISSANFSSAFTNVIGISMGVVGGKSQFPSSYDLYATALRPSSNNPQVPGSDLSGVAHNDTSISSSVDDLSPGGFPTAGNSEVDATKKWSTYVSALATGSFYGDSGINPMSVVDGTGILHEDLWGATSSSPFAYLGFFTLNFQGLNPVLDFTPSAVPEPSAAGLFALGGFACLLFAGKLNRKNA